MYRDRWYLGIGIALLVAAAGLYLIARKIKGFAVWYARHVYPGLVGVVGRIFGIFPFSVVEICLYLLIIGCIVYLVIFFRQPARVASRLVFLAGALLFSYVCDCGVNYYAASFAGYAGLEASAYSRDELAALCGYLVEKVNETAGDEKYAGDNRREWRQEGVRAMEKLGQIYPVLGGFYPQPKEVAVSWILSVQQLSGVYSPFTVEANFNGDMEDYNIPHTICHELSHLKGFMREDEANFIGYLACIGSERHAFRYSGYLTGWVYAGNALARADRETYLRLHEQLCRQAKEDLQRNNDFWDRYEGKVAEVSNQVNDTYLKINEQTDGVRSYGRMVDLMLEYYKDSIANQEKIRYNNNQK